MILLLYYRVAIAVYRWLARRYHRNAIGKAAIWILVQESEGQP